MKSLIFISLFSLCFILVNAQSNNEISGFITDEYGESLIGANVIVKELNKGTVTNEKGFFSFKIPQGNYTLQITYVGYEQQNLKVSIKKNQKLNLKLKEASEHIKAVEVTAEAPDKNVTKVEMSVNKLEMKQIQKLPVVFGEGDIVKTIQLLPGVISASEASGGFHVRGGNVDQNLILIDKAVVYNASHSIGFFSVFNSNVVDDVKLYKGGIPAEYGGRLSSVLDIKTIDPDIKEYHGEASLGIISSKAIFQVPVIKDKVSLFIAGRRTYADLFLPFAKDSLAKESEIYFYDLNAKLKVNLGTKDRIYLSAYSGRDILSFGTLISQKYGNDAYTFRWNHFFTNHFYLNNYVTLSKYDYEMKFSMEEDYAKILTNILDVSLKSQFSYDYNTNNSFRFGVEAIRHDFNPGHFQGYQAKVNFDYKLASSYSWEYGLFFQNEHTLTPKLTVIYGLRYSLFHNIGKGTSYNFNKEDPNDYITHDTTFYSKGEVYNFIPDGIEPRLSFRYMVNETSSIKASYNRLHQYIQLASNSTASLPLEYWFAASPNIKPQIVDQYAAGYFRNFANNTFEVSIEGFYKDIQNAIDFKDHANLILNDFYEGQLRIGNSWAYGCEFLIKKEVGDLTGWISYTYSRVFKKIPEINNGETYAAAYDKPHDVAVVLSYDLNERLNFAGTWVFTSAPPRTMPQQRFEYGKTIAPVYGDRNSVRIFPYHRLDLAMTYRLNKVKHNWEHLLNVSIYNTYARHNPIMISFEEDSENNSKTKAVGTYLYSFVPSISYTFKF